MASSLWSWIPVAVFNKISIAVIAALLVSAELSMPAAAQTIPDSADVTKLQNDVGVKNELPQKTESPARVAIPQHPPPPEAAPGDAASSSTMSGARLITAAAL